ncbi:MAG: DUF1800 domain-containing protein [Sandarakinorhabdus sp.]|nr:DUF1800 domain-containing protein [Sandarakinorhabdus sp.]
MTATAPYRAAIAANRFGLGARPGDAPTTDPPHWLISQFDKFEVRPAAIAGTAGSAEMARRFREYRGQIRPFIAANTQSAGAADPKQEDNIRRELRRQYRDNYGGQVRARVASAITTDAPFAERLVHFWANHFAVSADKLQTIGLAGTLEFEAIRPHITGTFGDLLMAVETHPAMLLYLDQAQSIGPDSPLGEAARRRPNARRKPGLNENLAREILELHTLGVGNYAQADVQELARGLTGFSLGGFVRRPIGIEAPDGAFVFQPGWHEPGDRSLLGKRYRQSGFEQPRAMLADLAVHPATARHLATKLARHFIADTPPPAVVDRIAAAHIACGGDLMALYRVLVDAPESWAGPTPKFKTPWDWTISALRATGSAAPDLRIVAALAELGQPVWRPGSPAGWDDIAASWAAPEALLRRVETAGRLAAATGNRLDARALAPKILPGALTPATAQAIARAETGQQALALLLASPEFLRR